MPKTRRRRKPVNRRAGVPRPRTAQLVFVLQDDLDEVLAYAAARR